LQEFHLASCRHWCFDLYQGNRFEASVHRQVRRGHCSCQFQDLYNTSAALPIRILCLASGRLLSFRRRDFAFYRECNAVCAWHSQACSVASDLQPSTFCACTARHLKYECDRRPQHVAFWRILGYLSCMTGLFR
jgi:hypothetical protein